MNALEIDVYELARRRQDHIPHVLLDVRESDEFAVASIEGALHIPMGDIPARLDEIPKDVPVILMCHAGTRSARTATYLMSQGRMNVMNLKGGIEAWLKMHKR